MSAVGLSVLPEVAAALAAGRPVVALESTIVSHGLPRPDNLRVARQVEAAVRAAGAVPATVAVMAGSACIGLSDAALEAVATRDDVRKVSLRDLGPVVARGGHGATTVAATAHLAARAGIAVFATGGVGGVHRAGPPAQAGEGQAGDGGAGVAGTGWDESADLVALARTPVTVVCSGVKSILDVAATLERLETLSVPVLGYRTDRFPAFYLSDSGHPLDWRVDTAAEVAAVMRARERLGVAGQALLVVQPLPAAEQLDPRDHDRVLADALAALAERGVTGKAVTPFLLERFHRDTGGASVTANVRLVLRNAALAAEIAVAYAAAAGASA